MLVNSSSARTMFDSFVDFGLGNIHDLGSFSKLKSFPVWVTGRFHRKNERFELTKDGSSPIRMDLGAPPVRSLTPWLSSATCAL
jgi:hypothetical protein